MGKSLDLPDPLESASPQPLENADDLLAQMAGEEVDRLLAEADDAGARKPTAAGASRRAADEPPTPAPAVPASSAALPGPAMPAPQTGIQDQLDALFSEITAEQPNPELLTTAPPPAPSIAPDSTAPAMPAMPGSPVASRLPADVDADEVMAAILGDPADALAAPPPAPAVIAAPVAATPDATAARIPSPTSESAILASSVARAEIETSAAERHGLADPQPADAPPTSGELKALTAPIDDDERTLPIYLKPLEWMNAPLDLLPTTFRDVLGQAAILTLVNAIAVLIYVFVFRRS